MLWQKDPLKKHLNTLFVTTQGAYLSKEGETVVVKNEGKTSSSCRCTPSGGIVCFGQVMCSPFLMGFCAENKCGLSFLTENGRFLARVQGPVSGNVLLRRRAIPAGRRSGVFGRMAKSILVGKDRQRPDRPATRR